MRATKATLIRALEEANTVIRIQANDLENATELAKKAWEEQVTVFAVFEGARFVKVCHTREEAWASIARWSRAYDWHVVAGTFTPNQRKRNPR